MNLVRVLGDYGKMLSEFCRCRPEGTEAEWRVECKSYETGDVIEIWAEIAFRPGHAVVWWMDIVPTPDGTWSVAGQVSANGQETLRNLGERRSLSFQDMVETAGRMLTDLLVIAAPPESDGS